MSSFSDSWILLSLNIIPLHAVKGRAGSRGAAALVLELSTE